MVEQQQQEAAAARSKDDHSVEEYLQKQRQSSSAALALRRSATAQAKLLAGGRANSWKNDNTTSTTNGTTTNNTRPTATRRTARGVERRLRQFSSPSSISSRSNSSAGSATSTKRQRTLSRHKSKWEDSICIIDELLAPGSKTAQVMTGRQKKRLWDVKISLLDNMNNRQSTQHVPQELLEVDKKMDDTDKPQADAAGVFILREYAGVTKKNDQREEEAKEKEEEKGEEEGSANKKDDSSSSQQKGSTKDEEGVAQEEESELSSSPSSYLPKEFSSMKQSQQTELFELLKWESISSWDFDVFQLDKISNGHPLLFMGWAVISAPHAQQAMAKQIGLASTNFDAGKGYNFMKEFNIPPQKLCNFLRVIEGDYNTTNPYHNSIHAADVVQTLHTLIQKSHSNDETGLQDLPPINLFAILLAAVVHDVEHPGKTNAFQVKIKSELALVHNDASVLENHHVSHAFATMFDLDLFNSGNSGGGAIKDGGTRSFTKSAVNRRSSKHDYKSPNNLLCNVTSEQFDTIRKLMIEAILHTDMTKHFEGVNAARGVLMEKANGNGGGNNGDDNDKKKQEQQHSWTILMYMLHMSDISSQAKGSHLFSKWSKRCMEEFFLQGDLEIEIGLLPVSALCDRHTTSIPEAQVGFIKWIVEPAFLVLGEYSSFVKQDVLPLIYSNLDYWSNAAKQEEEEAKGVGG